MSERVNRDLSDVRLDEMLRAIVGSGEPSAMLRGRVMAAIESRTTGRPLRRASSQLNARRGGRESHLLASFAPALALAALVAIAVAVWWTGPGPRVPASAPHRTRNAAARELENRAASHAAPEAGGPLVRSTPGVPRRRSLRQPALATVADRPAIEPVSRWAALPLLDPPAPLHVPHLHDPPIRVTELQIERLSIDALDVAPLDRSDKE
jgi:hypothetical protein